MQKSRAKLKIDGVNVKYKGILNADGQAFGHGIATSEKDPNSTWKGTFRNNKLHGIGMLWLDLCLLIFSTSVDYRFNNPKYALTIVQEFRMGERHGKRTFYHL